MDSHNKNVCNTCDMKFSLLKNLKRHIENIHKLPVKRAKRRISTQESEHKCLVCHRAFIERSSLRRHEIIKHKAYITPSLKIVKPNKCTIFEKSDLIDYPQLKKLIPEDYTYKVGLVEKFKNGKFKAKFEIADCSQETFFKWLSELSKKSLIVYKVKSFTKSPNPKTLFNKVFRCVHNTFPKKYVIPHPKHTGCEATLSVRILKCSEALSVKCSMANNSICMIYLKAIVTLNHCHNHFILKTNSPNCSFNDTRLIPTNKEQFGETFINNKKTVNLNQVCNIESTSLNTSVVLESDYAINESENDHLVLYDYIQEISVDTINDDFELNEEEVFDYDKYILVETINTGNTFNNDGCKTDMCENKLNYDVNDQELHQQMTNYNFIDDLLYTLR